MPDGRSETPVLVKMGLACACVVSLLGIAEYGRFESAYQRQNPDLYKVAAQFSRFADLRAAVPANGTLGYITDQEPGSLGAATLFSSAQYALAPRLLKDGVANDLVLGNFARPTDFQAAGTHLGLHMVRDFGSGVVLYRKPGQ